MSQPVATSESDEVLVPSLGMALGGSQTVTPLTADHWRLASEGTYSVPTCERCGTNYWPVTYACYHCGSLEWTWQPVAGTGRVFTYTWIDTPTHPEAGRDNLAVIELDATKGEPVRVPGWVEGVDDTSLVCDLPVEVAFRPVADGVAVPYWRPR